MTAVVQAVLQDRSTSWERYEAPSIDEIDPSFIHMHAAVMERSDFDALEAYNEPVEPRVIEQFDYAAQKRETVDSAAEFVATIANRLDRLDTVYDRIFDIIRSKRYRAGTAKQTRFDDNKEIFRPIVERQIADGEPLQFVLPSFPFKHNNPVKVGRRSADMAEVLCLSNLYEACLALGHVYEPGARFVIVCDGLVYREMFGITRHEALTYRERVREMVGQLGYDDAIEIADMEDLVASRRADFDVVEERLRPVFAQWWRGHPEDLRRASLIQASSANLNTSGSVSHDLLQMTVRDVLLETDDADAVSTLERIKRGTVDRAEQGAFEFALFLYVLKELDLVGSCYPRAVRATVHPKPGQWGLHLVNRESRVFPWQGVAYRNTHGKWRIKYEFEAARRRATPVHLRGDDEMYPFYYEYSEAAAAR